MKRLKITEQDYLKAHRRASRAEAIAAHGKPLRATRTHRSKKVYDRNQKKAELKALPFDFLRSVAEVSCMVALT